MASSVLYGVFAITGFFAGSINVRASISSQDIKCACLCRLYLTSSQNVLGPRLTLSLGTTGYSIYIGGLWAFQVHGTRWFLILAGGILGFCMSLSRPNDLRTCRLIAFLSSRRSVLGRTRGYHDVLSSGKGQRPLVCCLLVSISAWYPCGFLHCPRHRGPLESTICFNRCLPGLYDHHVDISM